MTPINATAALLAAADRAGEIIPPSWPLSSTIAVNPLAGFEDRSFGSALGDAARLFGAHGTLAPSELRQALGSGRLDRSDLGAALDRRFPDLGEWQRRILVADLAEGVEDPAPRRRARTVAETHDDEHGTRWATRLRSEIADRCAQGDLPPRGTVGELGAGEVDELAVAILAALDDLGVPAHAHQDYLERHLSLLPGWVAHLRWKQRAGDRHAVLRFLGASLPAEAALVDGRARYREASAPVATSAIERARAVADALGETDCTEAIAEVVARLDPIDRLLVAQDAYEHRLHDEMLASIGAPMPSTDARALAQVVCCIDVRSEPLRRHLEAQGSYETFGYAGFFGLAVRVVPAGGGDSIDLCPVLIEPNATVTATRGDPLRHELRTGSIDAWKAVKRHPIAPLALAEAAGWLAGPIAAIRTFRPTGGSITGRDDGEQLDRSAISLADQADVVAAILSLGVERNPARLVVLCGHTSHVANNPTESGLTCGACGGHGGGTNARLVAAMGNDPDVRRELARRGRALPDDTVFVAAVHDTALDRVTVLDPVPGSHRADLERLVANLDRAAEATTLERSRRLPGPDSHRGDVAATRRRAFDWAEPVAELGLAGNAAFIVGPRSMTAGVDLGGRAFLHSYDHRVDPDGSILAGILTAPLIVAQWINAQYHFSTTDPEIFGSGSKAVHNVVGDIGVLSGPGGDLRRGLPLQSVRAGDRLLHEPVRLLAAVAGRRSHIDAAIAGSPTLRRLVENEWIHLVAREPDQVGWMQRDASGWTERPTASRRPSVAASRPGAAA